MLFNDLLTSGCCVQGPIMVTWYDHETEKDVVLYEGDGDDLCFPYDDWGDREMTYIYYDRINRCMRIELEMDDL